MYSTAPHRRPRNRCGPFLGLTSSSHQAVSAAASSCWRTSTASGPSRALACEVYSEVARMGSAPAVRSRARSSIRGPRAASTRPLRETGGDVAGEAREVGDLAELGERATGDPDRRVPQLLELRRSREHVVPGRTDRPAHDAPASERVDADWDVPHGHFCSWAARAAATAAVMWASAVALSTPRPASTPVPSSSSSSASRMCSVPM